MKDFSLAQKAQEHYNDVKVRLAPQTERSIAETKVYSNFTTTREDPGPQARILRLLDTDSVSCLFNETEEDRKIAILNFASYKFPGGLYLQGSHAQEEALCHASNLFPILKAFDDSYYDWNRHNLNKALYLNRALYTPNVVFEKQGKIREADVLTCAAPNFYTAGYRLGVSEEDNLRVFKNRIHFMYRVAEENEVETLIAGAWGCGVFAQNPRKTARMMIDILNECHFKLNVTFAVPQGNANYAAFERELFDGME